MLGLGNNVNDARYHIDPFADNYSLSFDGTDDYVSIDGVGAYLDGTVGTISLWIKIDAVSTTRWLFYAIADANNYIRMFWHPGNKMYFQVYGGDTYSQAVVTDSGSIENDGNWHHIVGTWNEADDEVKVYLDGTLKDTGDSMGEWAGTISDVDIGNAAVAATDNTWDGKVADVAMFNEVVDVSILYNSGTPKDVQGPPGLVGYFRWEEGERVVSYNHADSGLTYATLVNGTGWDTDTP